MLFLVVQCLGAVDHLSHSCQTDPSVCIQVCLSIINPDKGCVSLLIRSSAGVLSSVFWGSRLLLILFAVQVEAVCDSQAGDMSKCSCMSSTLVVLPPIAWQLGNHEA